MTPIEIHPWAAGPEAGDRHLDPRDRVHFEPPWPPPLGEAATVTAVSLTVRPFGEDADDPD